ncbi:DUF692 family multinuclear iron-containing protein [Sorangium cellulosum]|uniref:multinuclear nonheme iron-dependent oxidase n=1 Tax=Sorangium cellulosum TaxID=56 RepID=UPI003D9A5DE9
MDDQPAPMRLGVNWTKADDLPLVRRLIEEGFADYCEILIDNFLHVEPHAIRRAFGDVPLAFHIMHSRFIERPEGELAFVAQRVRRFIRALDPMYVSDHLLRFTVGGRSVAFLPELDYERQGEVVIDKVRRFQDMLERAVCFENYPSILGSGRAQPDFFQRLIAETGAGLLFDFSNAVIAQRNCGVPTSAWAPLAGAADHFHAAGYDFFDGTPAIALDLHGTAVAGDTLDLMAFARAARGGRPLTVTLERDHNVAYEAWRDDLIRVRSLYA